MPERLLLHVCCAPCATVALERLTPDYDVECFFYNPNVQPLAEYDLRLDAARKLAAIVGVPLSEGLYDTGCFLKRVEGNECEPEGGERCRICFEMRLTRAAQLASDHGFDCFATTLSTSPHKAVGLIDEAGRKAAAGTGVEYLPTDLKRHRGFNRSVELCREYDLFRQSYCGCLFSFRKAGM